MYMVPNGVSIHGVRRLVTRVQIDSMFQFVGVMSDYHSQRRPIVGDLVVAGVLQDVLGLFGHWRTTHLRALGAFHGVNISKRATIATGLDLLRGHRCTTCFTPAQYVFQVLSRPRVSKSKVVPNPDQQLRESLPTAADVGVSRQAETGEGDNMLSGRLERCVRGGGEDPRGNG